MPWIKSEDLGLYVFQTNQDRVPIAFCLGDRHVHWIWGKDCFCNLAGSTLDNWHGYQFGTDLSASLEWIRKSFLKSKASSLWNAGSINRNFLC